MTGLIAVHGYHYDPNTPEDHKDNPSRLFAKWSDMVDHPDMTGWGWFSVPFGFRNCLRSIANGHLFPYYWAWDLARLEGKRLREYLQHLPAGEHVDMVGHSLGSRVIMQSLYAGAPVRRVLFLNGAEHIDDASKLAWTARQTRFLNIAVTTDDILAGPGAWGSPKIGKYGCIGQVGLRRRSPPNWRDFFLDVPAFQDWGRDHGYPDLQGDDPRSIGDHKFSYEHEGNHQLYRDWFKGTLEDF